MKLKNFTQSRLIAVFALGFLSLIWGYNWVVVKVGLEYTGPFQFVAIRMSIAAVVIFVTGWLLGFPMRMPHPKMTLLLGFVQTLAYSSVMTYALVRGGAGKTAILTFTMPFWILILAWLFLGEHLHGYQWPIVFLAFIGIMLVLEPWHLQSDFISSLLALGGGILWATSVLIIKKIRLTSQRQLLALTAWQLAFGSIGLIALAILFPARSTDWQMPLILTLLYSTVISAALGWLLWFFILQRLPANISSLSTLAVPVIGVLAGWIQLHDVPDALEIVGIICISIALGGLALTTKAPRAQTDQ